MKKNLIIVGAGASGLIAARELSVKFAVTLLESQQQAGGRIRTHVLPGTEGVVESGAEFIHGKLPITLDLCKKANIEYLPIDGKVYRKQGNDLVEENEFIGGWDELIKKMGSLKQDMTLSDFFSGFYSGDDHADLRRQVSAYVQGFDLADPKRVSVQSLYQEWSHEDEDNFRMPAGYGQLVQYLESACLDNGCTIVRGDAVRQIDWQQNDVTAYTASGKKYAGEKMLVTVPLGILTDISGSAAINFTPPIDDRIKAASDIGYGSVIKVVIHFKVRLWKEDTLFMFSDEIFPTWWTQLPQPHNLLTGWAGGLRASDLDQHSDEELLEIALTSLSHLLNLDTGEVRSNLLQAQVFNWKKHPDALGAYSYATPETAAARKLLSTPLAESVFFAGEGLYEGNYPGTVEAALASGLQVARQILHT